MKKTKWGLLVLFALMVMPLGVRAEEITNVSVTTVPVVAGGKASGSLTFGSTQYSSSGLNWIKCSSSTSGCSTNILVDTPFVGGGYYQLALFIDANGGDTFSSSVSVTINGLSATISSNTSSRIRVYSSIFTVNHIYGFNLNPSANYTFPAKTEGYSVSTSDNYSFKVTNTSTASVTFNTGLSGSGASSFTIVSNQTASLSTDESYEFKISPKTGLSAGTYTATVTISGTNVTNKTFNVSFTVNPTSSSSAPKTKTDADTAKTTYKVTVNGGSADKTKAGEGETVKITADAAPQGKVFDKWTTKSGITFATDTSMTTTFKMSAKDVTVTATYKDLPKDEYAINILSTNGVAGANVLSAKVGEEITLEATANEGYHFVKWTVTSGDIEIKDNKFTMPKETVTIEAIFEADTEPVKEKDNFPWWTLLSIPVIGGAIFLGVTLNKKKKLGSGKSN